MNTNSTPPSPVQGLIDNVADNTQTVIREFGEIKRVHVALAKAEVSTKITKPLGVGIGLLVFALILVLDALLLLFITAAFGIYAAGLPLWASFGIIVLVLFLITAIVALVAVKQFKKVGPPDKSIAAAKSLVERLKASVKG